MLARSILAAMLATAAQDAPAPVPPLPEPRHLAWHELEYYAFVHFNMNTFSGEEWGSGKEPESLFAPTELDCRQWARVARDAGMKAIILTAKHHDGFCLWPSKLTSHTVASSSWKDGKGDVLRELSDACQEFGLKFGVYLSPWDRNQPCYGDSPKYNDFFVGQLEEVLTQYGPVFEVWFDGACGEGPNGKKQVYDWPRFVATVREHQPDAVIFSDAGPDVRWVGNENGFAGETCWSMLKRDLFYPGTPLSAQLTEGHEDGTHWVPAECDVSIRPGWYYHAEQDDKVKSVERLMEIWYGSVGRNGSLLLNLPVDRRGLVHENDVARLMEFKAARDAAFGKDLARNAVATVVRRRTLSTIASDAYEVVDGNPATFFVADEEDRAMSFFIDLPQSTIDAVVLAEPIEFGQRVRGFEVIAYTDLTAGGEKTLASGTTIGRRRIVRFAPVEKVVKLGVRISDARACPLISSIEVFGPP